MIGYLLLVYIYKNVYTHPRWYRTSEPNMAPKKQQMFGNTCFEITNESRIFEISNYVLHISN
jgi:hypothetical protein